MVDGKAKSGRRALIAVLGKDHPQFDRCYRRWTRGKRYKALLRGAARAKVYANEFDDNDPRQNIGSFEADRLQDAEIGTYAFINQNSADWKKMGRAGWTPVEGFGHGEMLIRRDHLGLRCPPVFAT
jgi:hypothetical protein